MWFQRNDESEVTCAEVGGPIVSAIGTLEDGLQRLRGCVKVLERVADDLVARGDDPAPLSLNGKESVMDRITEAAHAMDEAEARLMVIATVLDGRW